MPTTSASMSARIGGVSVSGAVSRTAGGQISQSVSLEAGHAGSLTTRTDNDTGVATLSTGHGIVTSDKVDVFWTGGLRYGMTATVATNAVTVDGGAGDNLPDALTAVVVCKQVVIDTDFAGDDIDLIVAGADRRCHLHFQQNDGTTLLAVKVEAGEFWEWHSDGNFTNPLAGAAVGKACVSNGSSAGACELRLGVLYDSES